MIPERWLVVRAATPFDEDDKARLIEALMDSGGRAVWEEGPWSVTHLAIESGIEPDTDAVENFVRDSAGNPDLLVQTATQAHQDWEELWKVGLEPRRLTERVVVTPSWKTPETRDGDLVITVDPGMAFGNAEHGTTRGCIRILDACIDGGENLLDIGAGSAILSIAAAMLGAAQVLAVESDPYAIETAVENGERNGVGDKVRVLQLMASSDEIAGFGEHDGVIANIEAGLLRPLLPGLVAATRPGGWLLVSGILDHEWQGFRGEVEALGMSFIEVDADGEWRSGRFVRG